PARIRRALLSRRRRTDRLAEGLPLREQSRRALHHRRPPGMRECDRRRRLLRTRLQVLLGRRRDPRRPRDGRDDPAPHRLPGPQPVRASRGVTKARASRPWVTRPERGVEDEPVMELRALLAAPAVGAREIDPDAALVAAAREEPQAFLALYDRYFHRVLGYVRLRIRDEQTCEDVASTVFTTALAQLRRFRGDGTFAGWLFQIARNAVRDVQ